MWKVYHEMSSSLSSVCSISPFSNPISVNLLYYFLMYALRVSSGKYKKCKYVCLFTALFFTPKLHIICISCLTTYLGHHCLTVHRGKPPVAAWGLSVSFRDVMNSLKLKAKFCDNVHMSVFLNFLKNVTYF